MRRFNASRDERPAPSEKTVEAAAVALLARREHSMEELKRKLLSKSHPAALVDTVVARLAARNLASDERFTATFVQQHAKRGQGPVRIRAQLKQQGIVEDSIQQALAGSEVDWAELACAVRQRKFGAQPPRAMAERAKQARFLQYRGFDSEQIRAALSSGTSTQEFAGAADTSFELDLDT